VCSRFRRQCRVIFESPIREPPRDSVEIARTYYAPSCAPTDSRTILNESSTRSRDAAHGGAPVAYSPRYNLQSGMGEKRASGLLFSLLNGYPLNVAMPRIYNINDSSVILLQ